MDDPSDLKSLRPCVFCFNDLDVEDEDTYRQVTSWVSGPKLDGPKLREQTGKFAHKSCVELLVSGQAPDQARLFEEETPKEEPYDANANYDF